MAEKKIPHAVRTFNEVSGRRTEIVLPQVKGFNCYKGDFHIHTSYSDGRVNPAGRVVEAWMDGLDIIAITDHYEGRRGEQNFFKVIAPYNANVKYQSAKKANCVKADFNAIHQEAVNQLEKSGYPMLVIKGCEMLEIRRLTATSMLCFCRISTACMMRIWLLPFARLRIRAVL